MHTEAQQEVCLDVSAFYEELPPKLRPGAELCSASPNHGIIYNLSLAAKRVGVPTADNGDKKECWSRLHDGPDIWIPSDQASSSWMQEPQCSLSEASGFVAAFDMVAAQV